MNLYAKRIIWVIVSILYIILILICFSPSTLVRLTTGYISKYLDGFYFERRMQAVALFMCVSFILAGLNSMKTRKFKFGSRLFRHRYDFLDPNVFPNRNEIEIPGKDAFVYGIIATVVGIVATVWSLFFWIQCVIPEIF
jgi:hypothetical protein